jgi:hypothetical protein
MSTTTTRTRTERARTRTFARSVCALLGGVIKPIQITPEIADDIARELRKSDTDAERARCQALRQLDQRRQSITESSIGQ